MRKESERDRGEVYERRARGRLPHPTVPGAEWTRRGPSLPSEESSTREGEGPRDHRVVGFAGVIVEPRIERVAAYVFLISTALFSDDREKIWKKDKSTQKSETAKER